MEKTKKISGWQIHNQEKLFYQTNIGAPTVRLKFFHYPLYHQKVKINKFPEKCKLIIKEKNSFFIFQHQVGKKGIISLDRISSIIPILSNVNPNDDWGKISDFPQLLRRKYKQSSRYWPTQSSIIEDVSKEEWYTLDDLSCWVKSASNYIESKIKHRENQEERLGADYAFFQGVGDCDEFTDLFITIARMRGLPCRRLTGFFITRKKEIVAEAHAWGEIFSFKQNWIPIDIAQNNIGKYSINYVILKIEEFNPALPDYEIKTKGSSKIHYKWERFNPAVTPIYGL